MCVSSFGGCWQAYYNFQKAYTAYYCSTACLHILVLERSWTLQHHGEILLAIKAFRVNMTLTIGCKTQILLRLHQYFHETLKGLTEKISRYTKQCHTNNMYNNTSVHPKRKYNIFMKIGKGLQIIFSTPFTHLVIDR